MEGGGLGEVDGWIYSRGKKGQRHVVGAESPAVFLSPVTPKVVYGRIRLIC